MSKILKIKKRKIVEKKETKQPDIVYNSWRDTYDSIDDYEKCHGHGFWGNSTTGYINNNQYEE